MQFQRQGKVAMRVQSPPVPLDSTPEARPMTNGERRQSAIDCRVEAGDLAWLIEQVEFGRCACLGPRNGDPLCPCKMMSKAVRNTVSYAALKRGKILKLKR